MISPFNYSFLFLPNVDRQGWDARTLFTRLILFTRLNSHQTRSLNPLQMLQIQKKKKIEASIQIECRFDMHCAVASANAAAAERKTKAAEAAGLETAWGQREAVGAARSQMLKQKVSEEHKICLLPVSTQIVFLQS